MGKNGFSKIPVLIIVMTVMVVMTIVPGIQKTARAYGETEQLDIIWLDKDYEDVYGFSEGLARVDKNNMRGFIDKTGKEAIPLNYYIGAQDFSEGLAAVCGGDYQIYDEKSGRPTYGDDCKWGFIDKTGKEVIPFKYDHCIPFSEGLAPVMLDGRWGYVDKTGKEVIWLEEGMGEPFKEGLGRVVYAKNFGFDEFGFIDKTGKVITTKRYTDAENFSEGLALVRSIINNDYLYGFIDKTGREVIPVKFNGALSFSEGMAVAQQGECCGFIDKTGKFVLGMYAGCGPFSEGMALVMNYEDKYGYIDKTGKFIIPLTKNFYISQDIYLHTFREDFTIIGYDKYAYIDKTGKQITPLKYNIVHPFSEGLAAVGIKEETDYLDKWKFGYIDKTGKEIIPLIYDSINYSTDVCDFKEGVAIVKLNEKYGIMKKPLTSMKISEDKVPEKNEIIAHPTTSKVLINNKEIVFEAYNINWNNYFKLRDIAAVMNNTNKKFEVTWDGTSNSIKLITNKNYTFIGGELVIPANLTDMEAKPTTSKIFLDGKEVQFTAFNIKGNNYFKLRDIGKAIDFGVTWDGKTNTVGIDTSVSYTE